MFDVVFHLTEPPECFRAGHNVYITWTSGQRRLRAVCTLDDFRTCFNQAMNVFAAPEERDSNVLTLRPRA